MKTTVVRVAGFGLWLFGLGCSGPGESAQVPGQLGPAGGASEDAGSHPEAASSLPLPTLVGLGDAGEGGAAVCALADSSLPVSDDCVAFSVCGATCGRSVEYYCASGFRPNAPRCLDDHTGIGGTTSASCCDAAPVRASSYDGQCRLDRGAGLAMAYAVPLADAWQSSVPLVLPPSKACVPDGHARGPYVMSMIYCCP